MNKNDKLSGWQNAIHEISEDAAPDYVLVPRVPTNEMKESAYYWQRKVYVSDPLGDKHGFYAGVYREMLAAAPAPAVGDVISFELVERICNTLSKLGVSVPESREEQAARVIGLIESLCDEAIESKQAPAVGGDDFRFIESLLSAINDIQNELGFSDEEKECANGSEEIIDAIRELKEDAKIGAKWRENSSLEEWFPLTAEELARLKARPPATQGDAREEILNWAVEQWHQEVANRPMVNVHRRALDDTWRQVIRRCGADDISLIGPRHDDIAAQAGGEG